MRFRLKMICWVCRLNERLFYERLMSDNLVTAKKLPKAIRLNAELVFINSQILIWYMHHIFSCLASFHFLQHHINIYFIILVEYFNDCVNLRWEALVTGRPYVVWSADRQCTYNVGYNQITPHFSCFFILDSRTLFITLLLQGQRVFYYRQAPCI
jgi:hypothetical protein